MSQVFTLTDIIICWYVRVCACVYVCGVCVCGVELSIIRIMFANYFAIRIKAGQRDKL